jgi:hypothetical protein
MDDNMTLNEFLEFLANCSGDEAIDIITKFQCGSLTIENLGVEDFE